VKEPVWLNREDCLTIQEMMLAQHGGMAGSEMRVWCYRHSRNHSIFAYSSPTLAGMAASYASAIIINHPFLDGNQRTGFMLAVTFLERNGMEFVATEESVVEMTLGLASGKLKQAAHAEWLSGNARAA
jgi:death on curing protein